MQKRKTGDFLTSSEASRLLQVDTSSIVKWADSGLLKAFRTPGGHRRIQPGDLLAFLKSHGMYVPPELTAASCRVLYVECREPGGFDPMKALRAMDPQLEVRTARSLTEALLEIGSRAPDALVLDLGLTDLDGLEVCRHLRRLPRTESLKVIVLAEQVTELLQATAAGAGATALLPKPANTQQLHALLVA